MDNMLPIGKVAEIMGVTVQTLRYYSNIGLVNPAYINPETNYRYYSADQLHFIDRIKYLQKLGVSLEEIKNILANDDISLLLATLNKQKEKYLGEINRLQDMIDDIEWYKHYFTYIGNEQIDASCYSLHKDKRHVLAVKCREGEPRQAFHIRLNQVKSRLKDLPLKRQFSYILDYDGFMEGELKPLYLGLFLKNDPPPKADPSYAPGRIIEIPEGNYFCFKARILSESWDTNFARLFFEGKPKPSFVVANEYENSLHTYSQCVYEIQILIPDQAAPGQK